MTRKPRPPAFTKAQRLEVFETYGAIVCCQGEGCDSAIYIRGCHIDHHQAWIDDGAHELGNWRPLCFLCHSKKSAREHRNNAKCKRVAKKHSGSGKPKAESRFAKGGRPLRGRPFPECQRKLQSRPFPKPRQDAAE